MLKQPRYRFKGTAHTKSISFTDDVPWNLAKAFLSLECSRQILSYGCYAELGYRPCLLGHIKSPNLKRLCYIWSDWTCWPTCDVRPVGILRTVTRLILHWHDPNPATIARLRKTYDGAMYQVSWYALGQAVADPPGFGQAFKSLTHVCISMRGFNLTKKLLSAATKLRYFVLIHLDTIDYSVEGAQEHHQDVIRRVAELGDRRVVLVSKDNVRDKDLLDSDKQNDFWVWVEGLVRGGFLTDTGVRWEDYVSPTTSVPEGAV